MDRDSNRHRGISLAARELSLPLDSFFLQCGTGCRATMARHKIGRQACSFWVNGIQVRLCTQFFEYDLQNKTRRLIICDVIQDATYAFENVKG